MKINKVIKQLIITIRSIENMDINDQIKYIESNYYIRKYGKEEYNQSKKEYILSTEDYKK